MFTVLLVVATVLGAARITHLITDDIIFEPVRKFVAKSKFWEPAVECTFCVSVYTAAAATGWLVWRLPVLRDHWDLDLAVWPAMSAVIIAWEALVERLWP